MTTIVGGLRARLVRESLYHMLFDSLDQLNWFDTDRPHLPVTFLSRTHSHEEQIELNSVVLSDEGLQGEEIELGSQLTEHRWELWVDFFAENDGLGLHLIRDVKDILEGRMSSVGRTGPNFDVYDYRGVTPVQFATCEVEDVEVDRARGFLQPWLKHWYACSFTVVDYYDSDES